MPLLPRAVLSRVGSARARALCAAALACLLCSGWAGQAGAADVFYGAPLSAGQGEDLAWAAAWLDALDAAAAALARDPVVRLAELDASQLRGLAAVLPGPRALSRAEGRAFPFRADFLSDPLAEAKATGLAEPFALTPAEIPRALAAVEERARREEAILALERALPEALALAAEAHVLRVRGRASGEGTAERDFALQALAELAPAQEAAVGRVQARLLCLEALELTALELLPLDRGGAESFLTAPPTGGTDAALDRLTAALDMDPALLPARVAQAELLLREDRPRAVLRALDDLPAVSPGETHSGPDSRLLARGLRLRALGHLRAGQPALAEQDLDASLLLDAAEAETWLARGAVRQTRERPDGMCADYLQACRLGRCDGLAAARAAHLCPPN